MSEKIAFIKACLDRTRRIADVCNEFGISEKTGYKQLKRFKELGFEGLADRSHAALRHPHHITPEVVERIIALRRRYPLYGAQMLHDRLTQHEPEVRWPAASSIGDILKRANLIRPKRKRDRDKERGTLDTGRQRALEPNVVWTADFKGEFRLRNGIGPYCYPLTVMDRHSRFLLACIALETLAVTPARKVFLRLFREYGLPTVMRTDNGVPFCQPNALGRLGQLGFWWVRLGIRPEHIAPATPSENGAHERFHRTLKAGATKPAAQSFAAQQRRFDTFRSEYNEHRPHSSLPNRRPPGEFYKTSPRPYPPKLPPLIYPDGWALRLVQTNGFIKWRNERIFLSTNIAGHHVGITEVEGDRFSVTYGSLELGHIEAETDRFVAGLRWIGTL